MIDQATVEAIAAAIDELASEFRQTPGLLSTEADVKCHLIAKFARIGNLGVPVESADKGVRATAFHAEVPWFDDQDQDSDPTSLSPTQPL